MAGLAVVVGFAVVAILAPLISPFPRTFEAPETDRFVVSVYPHPLPSNLTYGPPVMGPTTPLSSDRQGGMWQVTYAREGLIFMDFLGHTATNQSPYIVGNRSFRLDISQDLSFGPFAPTPAPPLTALYYIVPAENSTHSRGPTRDNGALAFFAQRDFYVIDPFSKSLIFWSRLSFDPVRTGEDPASAGEMFVLPLERSIKFPGTNGLDFGPYRYFYASDLNHTVVFEVVYVNRADTSGPGSTPVGGQVTLVSNESLSAPPFVYYNQDYVTDSDNFRAGVGQAVLLPLTNGTLEVRNVTGPIRAWLPLTLNGSSATVAGSIGYTRSTFPLWLYVPLKSAAAAGVGILDMASLRVLHTFSVADPSLEPVGLPVSYVGLAETAISFGLYDPAAGPTGTTRMFRLNGTAVDNPLLRTQVPGRVRSYFEVFERSKVLIFTQSGELDMQSTVTPEAGTATLVKFPVQPSPTATFVRYAGAFGGTLYGSLIPAELYGVWIDPTGGESDVFQLLGTPRVPLPPGGYPSGYHYILGTDFKGGDILTQLFYGTQVAFIVGGLAAIFAVGVGTLVGLVAGYYGRIVDTLLMRTTDIFLVLPFLPIVLILAAILRPSIWVIILVLGIVGWPGIARVIRAQVLTLKERPFVDAARVSGASDLRLIFYQISPNVLPFSFLYMSLTVAGAIITEAALSFLGLGDITVTSWGGMLSTVLSSGSALTAWWWLLPPGLAITVLSLGFYMLGRGFDEIINPRLRRR
jgi:peptide/nickel transport system permease protein